MKLHDFYSNVEAQQLPAMVREKVRLLYCLSGTVADGILKVARLPPLPKLRIRKPNKDSQNPCVGVMSQLLGCWASSGYSIEGCGKIEESLRLCMDNKVGDRVTG